MKKIFFLLPLFFFLFHPARLSAKDFAAMLYKIQGTVEILPGNVPNPAWKRARVGMGLAAKDKIKTGENSSAQILLDDGSFCSLKSTCSIEILELAHDRKTKEQQSSIFVEKGPFLARVEKLRKNSRSDFKTAVVLAAVRGTELGIDVEEDGTSRVALYEGRIVVKDFAEESFVPREQDELLLEILHEISMKANQATTATKKGISKPGRIEGRLKDMEKELPALREENEKAKQEQAKLTFEQSQELRNKSREDALKP